MATQSLTVKSGDTISVEGLPAYISPGATAQNNQYLIDVKLGLDGQNATSILGSGNGKNIPAGETATVVSEFAIFSKTKLQGLVVPNGKYIKGLYAEDIVTSGTPMSYDIVDNEGPAPVANLPYGGNVALKANLADIPSVTATATNPIANTSIVTNVIMRVTHADGSTEDIGSTAYTFQDGDSVTLVATPYVAPNVTVTLPTIPAGDVVTDYSLAGATQGQQATLAAGASADLEITHEAFAVDVIIDYTNTTEPEVTSSGDETS